MGYDTKRAAIMAALTQNYSSPSYEEDEDLLDEHVVPVDEDAPDHSLSCDCWCEPELIGDFEDEGGNRVYLHRDLH